MIVINSVELSRNPVTPGESVRISVEIVTWDNLKAAFTWDTLKRSGMTWNQIKARGEK